MTGAARAAECTASAQFVEEAADAVSGAAVSFDLVQVAAAQGAGGLGVMSQVAVADHDGGFGQGELGAAGRGSVVPSSRSSASAVASACRRTEPVLVQRMTARRLPAGVGTTNSHCHAFSGRSSGRPWPQEGLRAVQPALQLLHGERGAVGAPRPPAARWGSWCRPSCRSTCGAGSWCGRAAQRGRSGRRSRGRGPGRVGPPAGWRRSCPCSTAAGAGPPRGRAGRSAWSAPASSPAGPPASAGAA